MAITIPPFQDAAGWERALYAFLTEKERRSGTRRTGTVPGLIAHPLLRPRRGRLFGPLHRGRVGSLLDRCQVARGKSTSGW